MDDKSMPVETVKATRGPLHAATETRAASNEPTSTIITEETTAEENGNDLTIEIVDETDYDYDDDDTVGLLGGPGLRGKSRIAQQQQQRPDTWMRPYWLGLGLFLILFAFWLLDSLKEPVFAVLVNGNMEKHQPPAKLCSVATTLGLVLFLEFVSHARKKEQQEEQRQSLVISGGGRWSRMAVGRQSSSPTNNGEDSVSASLFLYLGVGYSLVFLLVAYVLGFHEGFSSSQHDDEPPTTTTIDDQQQQSSSSKFLWHAMAYFIFAMIESFGSLTVATFWSYTNSTLVLSDAERYYGLIIALAQVGAIGGSTMVTSSIWSTSTLLVVACMVMLLMVVVMTSYDRRFPASSYNNNSEVPVPNSTPAFSNTTTTTPSPWSGVHLILKHNYVLLILGVSCLYEVALTCLDYQMKLLGFNRFGESGEEQISFAQFLGRFGQLTNILSLLISSMIFPYVIQKAGLRVTLCIFPTLLVIATLVAYTAMPGNLPVLFVSMSLLKAMTYSMHDPTKELLYMPTSNAIKFRAKFWIDVVGERIAKAIGSSINTAAGSVARSVSLASWPSILSALGLWYICYQVGKEFDELIRTGKVVGQHNTAQQSSHGAYQPIICEEEVEQLRGQSFDDSDNNIMEKGDPNNVEMAPLNIKS